MTPNSCCPPRADVRSRTSGRIDVSGAGLGHLLKDAAARLFSATFGSGGEILRAFAPGRINLIGEHVDYNQGPVMPVPLARGTAVAVRLREDGRFRLVSGHGAIGTTVGAAPSIVEGELVTTPATAPLGWAAYPSGMARSLIENGVAVPGFDLAIYGDLPIGAGLSSSASLLVATGRALASALSLDLDEAALARAAHRAETGFIGVSCGIMDPMAASLGRPGHALFLDCRDASFEQVPFDTTRLGLLVLDSATRRTLKTSRYNERVAECNAAVLAFQRLDPRVNSLRDVVDAGMDLDAVPLSPDVRKRAAHVIAEIGRVFAFKEALATGDLVHCGALVTQSHGSLRDLFGASTDELDFLVDRANEVDGVLGARLTGAGWGGCALALLRKGAEERLEDAVGPAYRARFGRTARFVQACGSVELA